MYQRICIFGASIVEGACDLPEKGGWANRLILYLKNNNIKRCYNLGISGNNSEDLIVRFRKECEARKPDLIIVAIGINDSQYSKTTKQTRVSEKKFEKNLHKLLKQGKSFTEKIVFVGLNKVNDDLLNPIPWDDNKDKCYDDAHVLAYNNIIKSFCQKNNLLFINIIDLLDDNDLEDGLHPNPQGHEKIFEKVKNELIKDNII